uniref:Conserved oligomeric Golgi complex subunit 2 n=1 Tax=Plectus sambesii TaxID=2011161 RepID=A0A914XIZ7_9BILA
MVDLPSSGALTQLCFNRAEFTRADFNVEHFLNALRRRTTLEQIQADLRLYLKILQNSMIELINEDYADFVNLSSNLVNLRATVDKLGADMGDISTEFDAATAELSGAVEELSSHLALLSSNRRNQLAIEQRIRLFSLLDKLGRNLTVCRSMKESVGLVRLERLTELMLSVKISLKHVVGEDQTAPELFDDARRKCANAFQRILDSELASAVSAGDLSRFLAVLAGYDACDRRDSAMAHFIAEFLETPIREKGRSARQRSAADSLQAIFEAMSAMRQKYSKSLLDESLASSPLTCSSSVAAGAAFLDECLLTVLLSILDTDFSEVLIPTDADVFHRCYSGLLRFATDWPGRSSTSLLKMALDKFSLLVYFRLRSHQLSQGVDRVLKTDRFEAVVGDRSGPHDFYAMATRATFDTIQTIWNDDVYLPPLVHKSWDLTGKLLSRYLEWLDTVLKSLQTAAAPTLPPAEVNGVSTNGTDHHVEKTVPVAKWRELTLIVADASAFEAALFELAFDVVWTKVRAVGGDTTPFGRCLTAFASQLKTRNKLGVEMLSAELADSMGKELSAVSEVPRQYRWTRKAAPAQPSPYLSTAFADPAQFISLSVDCFIAQDHRTAVLNSSLSSAVGPFLASVREVLQSVDKMSSSLSRLKRGSAKNLTNSEGVAQLSDDQKIRLQLQLDLADFRKRAVELDPSVSVDLDWSELNDLEVAARGEMDGSVQVDHLGVA